jgi:hypothetical protein
MFGRIESFLEGLGVKSPQRVVAMPAPSGTYERFGPFVGFNYQVVGSEVLSVSYIPQESPYGETRKIIYNTREGSDRLFLLAHIFPNDTYGLAYAFRAINGDPYQQTDIPVEMMLAQAHQRLGVLQAAGQVN